MAYFTEPKFSKYCMTLLFLINKQHNVRIDCCTLTVCSNLFFLMTWSKDRMANLNKKETDSEIKL
jgi:hypothetical protein